MTNILVSFFFSCEHHPIKVGSAFLRHEAKFYLYALYNKNKPKSDSLMSENGTQFFKTKQMELNDKMDLASYLLKPVQRMGKYALLLQQLMKACATAQVGGSNQPAVISYSCVSNFTEHRQPGGPGRPGTATES